MSNLEAAAAALVLWFWHRDRRQRREDAAWADGWAVGRHTATIHRLVTGE